MPLTKFNINFQVVTTSALFVFSVRVPHDDKKVMFKPPRLRFGVRQSSGALD
jgi:hypothetical protein